MQELLKIYILIKIFLIMFGKIGLIFFVFLSVFMVNFVSAQSSSTPTILSSPFFVNYVLPFLLVFVVVFAILQKTKVLGEGKRQIDAIVALVIGLIVIAFGYATNIIVTLVPFLAVSAIIILVFMLLYGMVYKEGAFEISKGLRIAFGIIIGIAVIIAVLVFTGYWDYLSIRFLSGNSSSIMANIIFVTIIVGAIIAVLVGGKERAVSK